MKGTFQTWKWPIPLILIKEFTKALRYLRPRFPLQFFLLLKQFLHVLKGQEARFRGGRGICEIAVETAGEEGEKGGY